MNKELKAVLKALKNHEIRNMTFKKEGGKNIRLFKHGGKYYTIATKKSGGYIACSLREYEPDVVNKSSMIVIPSFKQL